MCDLFFSTLFSETFLFLRIIERDNKCAEVLMQNTRYSCQILVKLEFSRQIFENYLHIKFHETRPVGAELFHADGQTDRQAWRN